MRPAGDTSGFACHVRKNAGCAWRLHWPWRIGGRNWCVCRGRRKKANSLPLAVLKNLEVLLLQIGNRVPAFVQNDGGYIHQPCRDVEDRSGRGRAIHRLDTLRGNSDRESSDQ